MYVAYSNSIIEEKLSGKNQHIRKHITGNRLTFTARGVITPLTRPHMYDEIDIPWAMGLELFKLPRVLGEHDGETISVAIGRFGPYVRAGKVFASIDKELDPLEIDFDTAVGIMVEKKEAIKNALIKDFKDAPDITDEGDVTELPF